MTKFVALLRGINVGGNKMVKMDDLKKWFAAIGFKSVKTILNSGNVLFESADKDEDELVKRIQGKLKTELGHEIGVQAECHRIELEPDDTLLLCSDGLTEMVPEDRIAGVLQAHHEPPTACERQSAA